jgi:transcriptional regulator with XRE-family HTH domain
MQVGVNWMEFSKRLAEIRKRRGLTQQNLADAVGSHVIQISRYETGKSQPTLEVLKKLAIALSVNADLLLFDIDERGPDDDMRLEFEAISKFNQEEKRTIKAVLKGLILKHEAEKWGP